MDANEWLQQIEYDLQTCSGFLSQIETILARIKVQLLGHSSTEISEYFAKNPTVAQNIIDSYCEILSRLTELKQTNQQEMQKIQKSTKIIHSYVQLEEIANFIDREL